MNSRLLESNLYSFSSWSILEKNVELNPSLDVIYA